MRTYYRPSFAPIVWGAAIALSAPLALWFAHTTAVDRAYAKGKTEASRSVAFDSALVAQTALAVALRTAHTDTIVRRVVVTRTRVESLLVALPDSAPKYVPVLPELVATTRDLLGQVDTLTHAITAERAAHTERAKVEEASRMAVTILYHARGDTIATLKKRPTRTKAVVGGVVAFVVGVLVGVAR